MNNAGSTVCRISRRRFLAGLGVMGVAGSLVAPRAISQQTDHPAPASPGSGRLTRLSEHLVVYHGPINVGIVRDGPRALLVDCGDGSVIESLKTLGITKVEQLLFTHHHRDQACGADRLAAAGARLYVPAGERPYFESVAAYWHDPRSRWHIYNQHPHHLMLVEPVNVEGELKDGQELSWGPARLRVLSTPGHTDAAISFLVEVDGRRVLFCGDAIYDAGQVWDLYSLQKGTVTSDYHGFLGARPQLARSLGRIKAAQPELLVPSHGRIMSEPSKAIDLLVQRLDVCYDRYVAISALRHYFPKMFAEYAGRPGHMPIRPGKAVPACLRHFGTTWVLVSQDRSAFVMDCGGAHVIKRLQSMLAGGEISRVEGLWVTHYHDDHVDAIPEFQKTFDCPCITDEHVAQVIADPMAWRLPCISPQKVRVDRRTQDGESWTWHEFRLTAFHLPGQTLYHSGLLVEGGALRMLFVGDSFTMAGIDDYCMHNRTWLGRSVGFDRCIALIEKLRPTHIFNCHVNDAFDFTPEECRHMRANLAEREKLFAQVVPWDNVNYAMDEPWVRCHPYEQNAKPGDAASFDVVVTNHSTEPREAACRAVLPKVWGGAVLPPLMAESDQGRLSGWMRVRIPPKTEGRMRLTAPVPSSAKPGRYVIPVDLWYADRPLPQFTEAIVVV